MTSRKDSYDYVIVGGGVAGASAVEGIRVHDSQGSIAVFGSEPDLPVYRPVLSKDLWLDENATLADNTLTQGDDARLVHTDSTVTSVQPDAHTVSVDGRAVRYGTLLLTTGGEPRTLELPDDPRVIYYRTVRDYEALRDVASEGARVVVVGGGFIGAEIASALVQNDVKVTMVLPGDYVQESMFPRELAAMVTENFTSRGVTMVHGRVASGTASDDVVTVRLEDGTEVGGDAVVVGLGIEPSTGLAAKAGLEVADGVVVDSYLRTGAVDVYAAGDVASYPDALLGRRRVEHVDAAETMGKAAGANMAGADEAYEHTPFFWSDLFDDGYEAVGTLDSSLETVIDWNEDRSAAVVYYAQDGRVKGVLLWNTWDSVPKALDVIRDTQQDPVGSVDELKGRIEVG